MLYERLEKVQLGGPLPLGGGMKAPGLPESGRARLDPAEQEIVPVSSLLPADSPRVRGEDEAHIMRLAEGDCVLPPIVVHRHSRRVIDGMHRVRAARINGLDKIAVTYFDGSQEDAFLLAVELNVSHGLPLSLHDRKAAAMRILSARPYLSDRAIASIAGLSNKSVAAIRARASAENAQLHARLGADGRVRPLDGAEGRRRAAEIISEFPGASLRDVAASAGISPGTVRDVRKRLKRGEDPAQARPRSPRLGPVRGPSADRDSAILPKLSQDPSLRLTEGGRSLLRWLHGHVIGNDDWANFVGLVPQHWSTAVVELAQQSANAWSELARQLEQRARD